MRPFGTLLLIAGLALMGYSMVMDTSVGMDDVDLPAAAREYVPRDMRVNNLGLMQRKQNFLIGGGVLAIVGTILVVAGGASAKSQATKP